MSPVDAARIMMPIFGFDAYYVNRNTFFGTFLFRYQPCTMGELKCQLVVSAFWCGTGLAPMKTSPHHQMHN